MKRIFFYTIPFALVFSFSGCRKDSKIPDLRETYSSADTKPFGTYAAKKIIESAYPSAESIISKRSFSRAYENISDTNAIFFCISRNLFLTEDDAQAMLDYVYTGNSLFISASGIDTLLLAKLMSEQVHADAILDRMQIEYAPSSVQLQPGVSNVNDSFSYFFKPFANHFSAINARYSRVLGYNDNKKPNCFILFWGKGRFVLHCDPRAFSNYFLLKDNNHMYLQLLLGLAGTPSKIYWDDYYRNQNVRREGRRSFSTFSEIMKHPPLATGLWIFVALMLLYVLFNSKRRQRIIPIIKPNENSSIAFTETIARLYLQHRDNKNIADKSITYFNEYIRKKYFLNTLTTNTDFISALSRKSGVSFEQTSELFKEIDAVNNISEVDDQQLLRLNEHIQQFYKNRN